MTLYILLIILVMLLLLLVIAQELPNWKGLDLNADGHQLTTESHMLYKQQMTNFFKAEWKRKGKVAMSKLLQRRLSNKFALLATDHALKTGVGGNLADVISKSKCLRLLESEERYFVEASALPSEIMAASPDRCRRSCVLDRVTGRTRLEVNWSQHQRGLIIHTDMGAATWPAKLWLMGNKLQPLHGVVFPDPSHRRHNNFNLALDRAQLSFLRSEALLVVNLGSGPWSGAGHLCRYAEAASEYVANYNTDDSLFAAMYSFLSFDACAGRFGPEFGSQEHMTATWESLTDSRTWLHKGETAKSGRWFQFTRRWRDRRAELSKLMLSLVYIGVHLSWWPSIMHSPLGALMYGNDAARVAEAGADAAVGDADEPSSSRAASASASRGHADPSRGVSASNLEAERASSDKNMLYLAASIIGNNVHCALLDAVCHVTWFVDRMHSEVLIGAKTVRGSIHVHETRASGSWPHLADIVRATRDFDLLVRMGVISYSDPTVLWKAISTEDAQKISRSVLDFVQHIISLELLDVLSSYMSFPGAFAWLLRVEELPVHLAFMQRVWEAVCHAKDSWVLSFVDSLIWPSNPFVRQQFIGLAEADWQLVPRDIDNTVRELFSETGTKLIEDSFNHLRATTSTNRKGHLGPAAQWHALHEANLLEESGREKVAVVGADRAGVTNGGLHDATFRPKSATFSLGTDTLKAFMADHSAATTMSAERHMKLPLTLSALLWCNEDYEKLKLCWLSRLLPPGALIFQRDRILGDEGFLVLSVSDCGAVAWKVDFVFCDGSAWAVLKGDGQSWEILHCVDPDQWLVYTSRAVAPHLIARRIGPALAKSEHLLGFTLEVTNMLDPMTPLQYNAFEGFKGWAVPTMLELWRWSPWPIPKPRPHLEMDVCGALVKFVFPDFTQDQVMECLARRSEQKAAAFASEISLANMHLVEDVIDSADKAVVVKQVARDEEERRANRLRGTPHRVPANDTVGDRAVAVAVDAAEPVDPMPASSSSSSGAGGAAIASTGTVLAVRPSPGVAAKARPVLEGDRVDIHVARAFCPATAGCTLSIHSGRAWQVVYKARVSEGPKSHMRTWRVDAEHKPCLLECLRWVWAVHTEAT